MNEDQIQILKDSFELVVSYNTDKSGRVEKMLATGMYKKRPVMKYVNELARFSPRYFNYFKAYGFDSIPNMEKGMIACYKDGEEINKLHDFLTSLSKVSTSALTPEQYQAWQQAQATGRYDVMDRFIKNIGKMNLTGMFMRPTKTSFKQGVDKELEKYKERTGKEIKYVENKDRKFSSKVDQIKADQLFGYSNKDKKLVDPREERKLELPKKEPTPELILPNQPAKTSSSLILPGQPQAPLEPLFTGQPASPSTTPKIFVPEVYIAPERSTPDHKQNSNNPLSNISRSEIREQFKSQFGKVTNEVAHQGNMAAIKAPSNISHMAQGFKLGGRGNAMGAARGALGTARTAATAARFGALAASPIGWIIAAVVVIVVLVLIVFPFDEHQHNLALCGNPALNQSCGKGPGPGVVPTSNLSLVKGGPDKVENGESINYNITASYTGYGDAKVEIIDILPKELDYEVSDHDAQYEESTKTVKWEIEKITSNSPVVLTLRVKPNVSDSWVKNNAKGTILSVSGVENLPPNQDNCAGKSSEFPGGYPLKNPLGNFGDPACNFTKDQLFTLLTELDPSNAYYWFNTVVRCESGYSPNAFADPVAVGTPDSAGAWGLFQMGRGKNGQYDHGDIVWQQQIINAVTYNNNLARPWRYWECAKNRW